MRIRHIAAEIPSTATILASPNSGDYTAIVSGINNSTRMALVEVYKLD